MPLFPQEGSAGSKGGSKQESEDMVFGDAADGDKDGAYRKLQPPRVSAMGNVFQVGKNEGVFLRRGLHVVWRHRGGHGWGRKLQPPRVSAMGNVFEVQHEGSFL